MLLISAKTWKAFMKLEPLSVVIRTIFPWISNSEWMSFRALANTSNVAFLKPSPLPLPRGQELDKNFPLTRPSWLAYLHCRLGSRGAHLRRHEFQCHRHRSASIRPHSGNTGHVWFGFWSRITSCNSAYSPIIRSFMFEVCILIPCCSLLQDSSVLQNEWAFKIWLQCKHTSSYQ